MEDLADKGTRAGAAALLALTAGVIVWLLAYWFWQIALRPLPPPAIALENQPETLAQQVRSRNLFGQSNAVAAPVAATAPAPARMTLVGIVSAASGKKGFAVIVVEGKKAVTVRVGEEVAPGLMLTRIARDQVELTQDGRMINLMLSSKK